MLKVRKLDTYYESVQSLNEISIEVKQGEITTILGANGAGKTTLLKTILGLIPARNGDIEFMGQRIEHESPDKRVKMGISLVPEGRELFVDMTVSENLEMGAYLVREKREIRKEMEKVFSLFSILSERKNQQAGTLSGGEQQLLSIARSLMSRPKLVLMDEPSLGLAPVLVEAIYKEIVEIKQRGTTILLVEQNANLALSISSYGYILETGKMKYEGYRAELEKNEEIVRSYLGE